MKRNLLIFLLPIIIAFLTIANAGASSRDTYLPEEVQDICVKYGEEYCICPELLMAIVETESSGKQYAENDGCKGLTQIYEKFHKDRMEKIGVTDIYDMDGNVHVAADYLAELFEKYEDTGTTLMVYHGEKKRYIKGWTRRNQQLRK
jgi:soluble lytic murein transglycosylase-like protein